jgi:predicted nucleotidyltransferase
MVRGGPYARWKERDRCGMIDCGMESAFLDRDLVIDRLRAHEADLHRCGVGHLYLFGSVARDEARPDSDVDLFFDTGNPRFSLIELVDIQERVGSILGVECDVMTRASLHPMLRPRIEAEARRVF